MSLSPGTRIGSYEIVAPIGKGGMGEVYRARDTKLERDVAIKVLPDELAADGERVARFEREAKFLASLNHPNIASIHGFEESDGVEALVLELVEGPTLAERIEDGPLPIDETIAIAKQIAAALEAGHEAGVIHRDLKPANVKVKDDGTVKVLDYGLAKALGGEAPSSADSELSHSPTLTRQGTQLGMILGTAAYMSPEQATGKPVDKRTDVWAFGAVLYEMLTGRKPFRGDDVSTTLAKVIEREPDWGLLPTDLSPVLATYLRRCLMKDPRERIRDIGDVGLALEGAFDIGVSSPTGGRRSTPPTRTWLVGAGTVVTLIAALSLVIPSNDVDPTPRVVRTSRLTYDPGLELDAALSPDGRMVAYAKGTIGNTKIYVQQTSGGSPVALTVDFPGVHFGPRWSPDGSQIAFAARSRSALAPAVYVVPALGGAPRRILDRGEELAWAPDGSSFVFVDAISGDLTDLYTGSLDGGREKIATLVQAATISWSPDGERIAYSLGNAGYPLRGTGVLNVASSSIWIASSDGSDAVQVTGDNYLDSSPQWAPDGRHLYFVSDRGGSRDIYRLGVSAAGEALGDPARLTVGLKAHTFSLSADGTRLAYSDLTRRQNIWSLPISASETLSVREAEPVTIGNQEIEGIAVSYDGEWLAFDSNRSGNQEVYKMPIRGGDDIRLTTHPAADFVTAWSPDGSELLMYSLRSGNRDVYAMSSDGGSVRRLTDHPAEERSGNWSADGKFITVSSAQRGGSFILSATGESPPRFTESRADYFSPDGRWRAGWDETNSTIVIASSDETEVRTLVESVDDGRRVNFSRDSQTVFYKTGTLPGQSGIWSVSIDGGEPRLIVAFDDPDRPSIRREFDVSNERVYFTLSEHESDVWLLELEN